MDEPQRPYAGRRIVSRTKPPSMLRKARTRARRSLRWLAQQVGCTAQFLSECETRSLGHRIPLPRLLQVATALEVDPGPLVVDEGLATQYVSHTLGPQAARHPELLIRLANVVAKLSPEAIESWVTSHDGGPHVEPIED